MYCITLAIDTLNVNECAINMLQMDVCFAIYVTKCGCLVKIASNVRMVCQFIRQ